MQLFTARSLVVAPGVFLAGGGILCDARVRRVAHDRAECRRLARHAGAPLVDLGDVTIAPGLVDAHAHLELSDTQVDAGTNGAFRGWVDGLMAARRECTRGALEKAARRGADRLLSTGTTAVGDIDSTGAAHTALLRHPIGATLYREVLDAADPARSEAALHAVTQPLELRAGMREGLSPHAPYTVSPALFAGLRSLAERRALPVTVHWAETEEEVEWTLHGTGPLAGLIAESPRRSGLDLVEAAGLLGPRTSLVHGNHPAPGELERIASAGAVCVHCPGSHAFFGREPFPFDDYERAGVPVALGTDSAASNADLDMRREMALFRRGRAVAPERVWAMATVTAARAIGARGPVSGTLHVGARADFCSYSIVPSGSRDCFEVLTAGLPAVAGAWVEGLPALADAG